MSPQAKGPACRSRSLGWPVRPISTALCAASAATQVVQSSVRRDFALIYLDWYTDQVALASESRA